MLNLPELPDLGAMFQSSTHVDALGNIFDSLGNHIGVKSGSIADLGSKSPTRPTTPSSPAMPAAKASSGPSSALSSLSQWAASLVARSAAPDDSLSLEDIVFIVLGLLLLGAALFSFKTPQMFVREATKSAIQAAKVAA